MTLLSPLITFDTIEPDELNACLRAWGHRMGELNRPRYGVRGGAHGLRHEGRLVAVAATEPMIAAETCGLSRSQAFELSRVCAERPGLCRVAVRLWREFVFPAFCEAGRWQWAISYQDAVQHTGALYRVDGWVRLGTTSSGTDRRGRDGTRKGRRKVVWGWTEDPAAMEAARAVDRQREEERSLERERQRALRDRAARRLCVAA